MSDTARPSPAASPGLVSAGARRIAIDPVTRLEGHAKIDILLDDRGEVREAVYQVPELRGFEAFCAGRPAEEMPGITSRICGVCPMAHHMAATKALDDLYSVEPTPTAVKVRELVYHAFLFEDHALHLYALGGPDLFLGPDAPRGSRNLLGVLSSLGAEMGQRVLVVRRALRDLVGGIAGRAVHPVIGLPGGVTRGVDEDALPSYRETGRQALALAVDSLRLFRERVLGNSAVAGLLGSDAYVHRTYYMGMVDAEGRASFYDGRLRVVGPDGGQMGVFVGQAYAAWIAERTETWTYAKPCYLKAIGWHGLADGPQSGIYAVGPLARLNVANGFATLGAHGAYEEFVASLGPKPIHSTLAYHWARVIEMLFAAERVNALLHDPDITGKDLRRLPARAPASGVGVVEAPRGTLIHHYETDEDGLIREANLIVATQHNAARIALSVDRAARSLIHNGQVNEGLLNRIEMALRAYDPCNACTTHSLPGEAPYVVRIVDSTGRVLQVVHR